MQARYRVLQTKRKGIKMKTYFEFKKINTIGITFFPSLRLGGIVFPPELRFGFWFFYFCIEFGKREKK